MEFYRGDVQVNHPTFAEGSQAVTQAAGAPTEISASNIVYSKDDDNAIDEFHRRAGSYYSLNTASLKTAINYNFLVFV